MKQDATAGDGDGSFRRSGVDDAKAIGLVGLAHGCSHFFQLVLPPLFPFLIADFGVGYTELGLVMTVFFVSSGLSQPPAGFLVDRIGARRVLLSGLALYSVAILLCAMVPSYWFFLPVAVLVGLGNSAFHPADFTILNASVKPERLGRAFGIHTLGGNLGWAAAPVIMFAIGTAVGWRQALITAAAIGIAILLILILNRRVLRDERDHRAEQGADGADHPDTAGLRPLMNRSVVMCFFYFVFLAASLIGVQNFLPTTLNLLHGTSLTLAGTTLTGFLLGASAGVLVGGFLADRSDRYAATIFTGLIGSAVLFLVVGWLTLPAAMLIAVVSTAGFLSGVTTPSRDMLVRSATPKGATGRVFGFVYSGLDAGAATAPLLIGVILDHGNPIWVTWIIALALFAAIFTAVSVSAKAKPALGSAAD